VGLVRGSKLVVCPVVDGNALCGQAVPVVEIEGEQRGKRRTGVMAEVMRAVSMENEDTKLYLFCGLGYCDD